MRKIMMVKERKCLQNIIVEMHELHAIFFNSSVNLNNFYNFYV